MQTNLLNRRVHFSSPDLNAPDHGTVMAVTLDGDSFKLLVMTESGDLVRTDHTRVTVLGEPEPMAAGKFTISLHDAETDTPSWYVGVYFHGSGGDDSTRYLNDQGEWVLAAKLDQDGNAELFHSPKAAVRAAIEYAASQASE